MSKNKLFLLATSILILGALGVGAYFYFFTDTFNNGISPGSGINLPQGFSPFGSTGNNQPPAQGTAGGQSQNANQPTARLFKLAQNPVAGYISTTIGSTTMIRYLEKQTGHSFDIDMSTPSARMKVTNTTIPRLYQALFGKNGSSVLLRYLDSDNLIQTYSATIPAATSTAEIQGGVDLKGIFLTMGIKDVSVSPSADKIFTLVNFGDIVVGTISNVDGTKKSQVFSSPFTEWLSSWTNDKTILLATKPSSVAPGYVYALDVNSESFKKIYGGTNGLTAVLSPDGKNLLVSESSNGFPSLKIYGLESRSVSDTGLKTIAEKCLWASNDTIYCAVPKTTPPASGGYPDAWYQGLVSFSDSMWKIDSVVLSTDLVFDISENARAPIDATNLATDKGGSHLFFVNKNDSSLWSLKLQ